MNLHVEERAASLLRRLEEHGYEAYIVGGYVRDSLLGKPTHDIDIATSAKPSEVVALFEHTIPTGLQHGTVTVMLERVPYEVTTFRTESDYEDHRRPKEVAFVTSLEEDLKRRDFTINAIALNRDGERIDPFGGEADLRAGVLRCVGRPEERFREDALRMIRCIRFASNLGFRVEEETWQALLTNRELLRHVAIERVFTEWNKLMGGPDPYRGTELLAESRLLHHLKRETTLAISASWTGKEAMPAELSALPLLIRPELRWALLMRWMQTPLDLLKDELAALTFPGKLIESIVGILRLERDLAVAVRQDGTAGQGANGRLERLWKRMVLSHGEQTARDWLEWSEAITAVAGDGEAGGEAEPLERLGQHTARTLVENGRAWLEEMPVRDRKALAVKGTDLIRSLDRPAGPWLAACMARLLEEAAIGTVPNETEALLSRAKTYDEE
ncbi:CCA-adding enzyme [Paenibacillus sp. J31TS4]|uniref:CCA tRNA nucleotidyltransferase n=1 Tax=Paenibacillus sp. J31TS4 TaxID=2807195 RepID=UPI001B10D7AD|nr:CCA tRNA nucleotidyltransferase [Paenibacillus sp. J31TS4]GIP37438.1 CCA-adding enzyme [Paenibacillus sp. J31TS4]